MPAPEEIHVDAHLAGVLVDLHHEHVAPLEDADHLPEGAVARDHVLAGLRPEPQQIAVDPRIVDRPRQGMQRVTGERRREAADLPVAQVTDHDDDPAALFLEPVEHVVADELDVGGRPRAAS